MCIKRPLKRKETSEFIANDWVNEMKRTYKFSDLNWKLNIANHTHITHTHKHIRSFKVLTAVQFSTSWACKHGLSLEWAIDFIALNLKNLVGLDFSRFVGLKTGLSPKWLVGLSTDYLGSLTFGRLLDWNRRLLLDLHNFFGLDATLYLHQFLGLNLWGSKTAITTDVRPLTTRILAIAGVLTVAVVLFLWMRVRRTNNAL